MRESDILDRIGELGAAAPTSLAGGWRTVVGPGDDGAVIESASGPVLLTVDQLVEGRHVEPGTAVDLIARKAVARSVSDIAAMGGTPSWALATGLLPDADTRGLELSERLHHWGEHWGCPMVGGDIAGGGDTLALTVTIGGVMAEGSRPMLRSGARPGHTLYVSGPIGASFESGWHARFEPRLGLGRRLAACTGAGAAIDISDGLGLDAHRIATASGVRIEIDAGAIPLRDPARGWRRSAGDGEDYELLFTHEAPRLEPDSGPVTPIGRVAASGPVGAWIIADGHPIDASALGWDHGGGDA